MAQPEAVVSEHRTFLAPGPVSLRWGAIFGGAFVAAAFWILFYALGLAVGLTSIHPEEGGSFRALGIGTGVWGILAPLVALFLGGTVAARSAGLVGRAGGMLHGLVMWALVTLLGISLFGAAVSAVVGSVAQLGRAALGAAGNAAPQVAQSLGIDASDLVGPLNERLTAQGKPPVRPEELQAVVQESAATFVREGGVNRAVIVNSLARHTQLDRSDAEDVANQLEQRFQAAWSQLGQVAGQAAEGAAEVGARVFWGLFGVLLLGLLSSVLGGLLGARSLARVVPEPPTRREVPATRREVYP